MVLDYIVGFSLGLSLIVALGAQNAFVIRQGIRKEHVIWVCLTCSIADTFLILLGIFWMGTISDKIPSFEPVIKIGAASFLVIYGSVSAMSAIRDSKKMSIKIGEGMTRVEAISMSLAFAFLNPHVYLETVFLIGSLSSQYSHSLIFGLGAISASFVFFFSLGFASGLVAPIFQSRRAWRYLDGIISMIMFSIAFSLIFSL